MRLDRDEIVIGAVALAAIGVAWYVWRKGGIGKAAVAAANDVAVSTVGTIGETVGLPTPDVTTTDPAVARWIIDRAGYMAASKWASAGAFVQALALGSSDSRPPPIGSAIAREFGYVAGATGDFARADRGATSSNGQDPTPFSSYGPMVVGLPG